MMKRGSIFLALTLAAGSQWAQAQDLENLLSEAADRPKAAKESAVSSQLTQTLQMLLVRPNSEQQIFMRHVEAKAWSKALLQYSQAFEGTKFQKSANGRALLGLVQFQAGLPVTGMETLFTVTEPKDLDPELKKQWKELVPPGHFTWELSQILWRPDWSVVFGPEPGFQLMARELNTVKSAAKLKELSEKAPAGSAAQAQIDWQLLLTQSMNDETAEAGKILARLMKSPKTPVGQDLMNLTAGRLLYQNGYFETAIKLYEKVPKTSEYWTEAQEEIAWAYIRKGEPQNAMAVSKSLVVPAMKNQVGPESYFVHSLSQLKVCDYTGVVKSLSDFSGNFKDRTVALENLAKAGTSPEATQAIELLKTKKAQLTDVGPMSQKLPRFLTKDETLYRLAQAQKYLEAEAQAAEALYAQSLQETGLQGAFDSLKKTTTARAERARAASVQRIQEMARDEVAETRDILRKMHIIEAEVIQQASLSDRIAQNAKAGDEKKGSTGAKAQDLLKFPANDELWFDEISNYKVDIKKACHAKR